MINDSVFQIKNPQDSFLKEIIDYYFFIDIAASELPMQAEHIIPFPRITFGYFFDYPFRVTNLDNNETVISPFIISRVLKDNIVVEPSTPFVKIIGAHLKPYALSCLTTHKLSDLRWLIDADTLMGDPCQQFVNQINNCSNVDQMFEEVERFFLENILDRDLFLVKKAIQVIEEHQNNFSVKDLSNLLRVSDRTLRNHFYSTIGCSPKDFLQISKMKQIAYELKTQDKALTEITYQNNYFDQAHFIKEVQKLTGYSPSKLKKIMPYFRFLQF